MPDDGLSILGLDTPLWLWIITTIIQIITVARWTWNSTLASLRMLRRFIQKLFKPIIDEGVDQRFEERMVNWTRESDRRSRRQSRTYEDVHEELARRVRSSRD